MQQAPGAEVVVVAVDRRFPADVAGVDLRAAELDRDAPVLTNRLRRGGERAAKSLHLLPLLVAQLSHLVLGRDRRVERVHVQAQRVGEDRVEEEEHRDAAAQADLVRRHADGLVADLGHEHVGTYIVEDAFERTESADGAGDAPRLGLAVAGPVGPVYVADVRQAVGLLDPPDLGVGVRARRAPKRRRAGSARRYRAPGAPVPTPARRSRGRRRGRARAAPRRRARRTRSRRSAAW